MSDRDAFRAEPGDLKTPDEWCKLLGYEVMDPDGWRGSNGRPWTDQISQAEFEARIVTCTLRRVDPRSTFRAEQQERRLHGLKARHETREARAQTVIGELEQQLYVMAERGFVRVVIADELGTSFAAMRLAPEAAERAIRILTQAVITASEVKVLTETASKVAYALGRKDAGEEISAALKLRREQVRDEGQRGWPLLTEAWTIALDLTSLPSQAASDATSGVPGHQEVSEAVRSPQEPCEDPDCPIPLMHTHRWLNAPEGNTP